MKMRIRIRWWCTIESESLPYSIMLREHRENWYTEYSIIPSFRLQIRGAFGENTAGTA